jgi:hypothetical protein
MHALANEDTHFFSLKVPTFPLQASQRERLCGAARPWRSERLKIDSHPVDSVGLGFNDAQIGSEPQIASRRKAV